MFGFTFGKKKDDAQSRFEFIYDCAKAAANLYGVMALADFAERVVGAWRPECRDEVAQIASRLEARAREEGAEFAIREDELVHVSILDDWARKGALRKLHLGRSPWLPQKEGEFLAFGRAERAEELCVPAAKAFRGLFGHGGPMGDASTSMAQPLIDLCRQGCGDDSDLDMAACLLPMTTGADGEKVARMLSDLRNRTRVWALFGATAEELGVQREVRPKSDLSGESADSTPTGSVASSLMEKSGVDLTRIGRNDPCPCGSGKKYKKCCGR